MLHQNKSSDADLQKTKSRASSTIERIEYQQMLLKGSLAFSNNNGDAEFQDALDQATALRKKFAVMLMREENPKEIEQMLLYMFEAEDHICMKTSPKLKGLASGYLVTLWDTVNDKPLKDAIGRGLMALHSQGKIEDDQLYDIQEFAADGGTKTALKQLVDQYAH